MARRIRPQINAFLTGSAQIQATLTVAGISMRYNTLIAPLAALALAACATTGRSDDEEALAATLDATDIIPASADERAAIRSQDILTQAAFWAEAHDLNPSDLEAATELSTVLRRLGNSIRAAEVAQQTLALYPDDPGLLYALGASLAAAGRGAIAIEFLARANQIEPGNWQTLNALGVSYEQAGDSNRARAVFREAMSFGPGQPSILSNLALSYALGGEAETAERMLREAMIRPGVDPTVRQNLALVMALQGRFAEAETMARLDVTPEMAEQNMNYVRAMLTTQRRYDAVRSQ